MKNLGRPPDAREAVYNVLMESKIPLSFTELKKAIVRLPRRSSLGDGTLNRILNKLIALKEVEIVIYGSRKKYSLVRKITVPTLTM